MTRKKKVLILGSSGFIGSNLAEKLTKEGCYVTGVDMVEPKYFWPQSFIETDLRDFNYTVNAIIKPDDIDEVYLLACLMGGMGFIGDEEKHGYDIGVGSTQVITNVIEVLRGLKSKAKVFFSSSACVYNQDLQLKSNSPALHEDSAIPANPDLLYGWQKLYAERMLMASGLDIRIARFHNIYGKWGVYDGGKEKFPAAICRKVASSNTGDTIEVWGDGEQVRSFLHIDEALEGVLRLMQSRFNKPLNIGSSEAVTINEVTKMVCEISRKKSLFIKHIKGPEGVRGRSSDNTLCQQVLGWKPSRPLKEGIEKLYYWISEQVNQKIKV